jgi:hypothetical protein
MILPYIIEIGEAIEKKDRSRESVPAANPSNPAEIQPNRKILIPHEENSIELSYLQFKEKIEKERFERELLVRNK